VHGHEMVQPKSDLFKAVVMLLVKIQLCCLLVGFVSEIIFVVHCLWCFCCCKAFLIKMKEYCMINTSVL